MTAGRLFDEENRGDRAHKGDPAEDLEGELDRGLHARLRRPRVPRPCLTFWYDRAGYVPGNLEGN